MSKFLIYGFSSNSWGGTEIITTSFIKEMHSQHQFDILLTGENCSYINNLNKKNIHIKQISSYRNNPLLFKKEVKALLQKENYDFVWINTTLLHNFSLIKTIKKYSSAKIIVHSHSSKHVFGNSLKGYLANLIHKINRRRYIKATDFHWCCSQKAGDWLWGRKTPYTIINNGIHLDKFQFKSSIREEYRKALSLENKLVLLTVGRLSEVKNQAFLIDAFFELLKTRPDAFLLIAGEGALRKDLEQKVENLEISPKVRFLGLRDDVDRLFQAADVFCLPSLYEGFPIVLVEAQTSGIPCLVSQNVSKECQLSEDCSFLPIDNIKPWVEKIQTTMPNLNREQSYKDLKKQGYDIHDVAIQIETLLGINK